MKRLITILLSVAVLISSLALAPVSAQAKVSYTKKTIDYSSYYWYGTDSNYAQYLVLKGNSKGIKKINGKMYSEAQKFLSYMPKGINEDALYSYYSEYGETTFRNTLKVKTTYNKGKVFAVKYTSEYYQGGVGSCDFYGKAFGVKTGRVLKLSDVVTKSYSPAKTSGYKKLKKYIAKKLAKKYDAETSNNFYSTYNSKKKLNNAQFYMNSKGDVFICFPKYEISYGARGCITVKLPSKYS